MAQVLDLEGSAPELAGVSGRTPLLRSADLVYLGVDRTQATDGERAQVDALGVTVVEQQTLCDDPRQAARAARDALPSGPFFVHLDVDVLEFLDAPIAENVNGRNSGPTIAQLAQALAELVPHPDCWESPSANWTRHTLHRTRPRCPDSLTPSRRRLPRHAPPGSLPVRLAIHRAHAVLSVLPRATSSAHSHPEAAQHEPDDVE